MPFSGNCRMPAAKRYRADRANSDAGIEIISAGAVNSFQKTKFRIH
jgi:hypothetical protein